MASVVRLTAAAITLFAGEEGRADVASVNVARIGAFRPIHRSTIRPCDNPLRRKTRMPTAQSAYLRTLLRTYLDDAPPVEPPALDWEAFTDALLGHRVLAAFAPRIDTHGIPDETSRRLDVLAKRLRMRSALLSIEMSRCIAALREAGIVPVVLKGAGLAAVAYRRAEDRDFADLDLLVERHEIEVALEALGRVGYGPGRANRSIEEYARRHFHFVLDGPAGIRVELHWDLTPPDDFARFDLDGLRRRASRVAFGEESALVPSPQDQVLHAASQAVQEGFGGLKRPLDVLMLRTRIADIESVAEGARAFGLGPAAWTLLDLAQALSGRRDFQSALDRLMPSRRRRIALRSLDLDAKCLDLYVRRRKGFRNLVRWLCAPSVRAARVQVLLYLAPEHRRDPLPTRAGRAPRGAALRRFGRRAERAWSVLKCAAYLGLSVARAGGRGAGDRAG